jgi:methionine synthase I (cobalamin-dependent)
MNIIIKDLLVNGPVLLDGAWGTELQARGLERGEMPDFWNINHPDRVEAVAKAYIDAGSQIVLTNTFRASRIALGKMLHDKPDDYLSELNSAGVKLSRQAANCGIEKNTKVFASIGPSGKLLLTKEVTEAELQQSFEEQASALAEGGADALVVETMTDLAEAKIAIAAAKQTGLPVVGCVVFDSGRDKDRTMMGVTPEEAAQELQDYGVDVIGANCGNGIENYINICKRYAATTDLPIWIKANAGTPELKDGEVVYNTSPEEFAASLPALIDAGASFIGGCCGTSPDYIRALKNQLERLPA